MRSSLFPIVFLIYSCNADTGGVRYPSTSEIEQANQDQEKLATLEGYREAERLRGEDGSSEPEVIEDFFANDEKLFEFEPPEGADAEFSEPIMVSGAALFLNNPSLKEICENLIYQKEEPTMKQVIRQSANTNTCGPLAINFCIRMTFNKLDQDQDQSVKYLQPPAFNMNLPCPGDSFNNLNISIEGNGYTNSQQVSVNIEANRVVRDVYLTESASCDEGGSWQEIPTGPANFNLEIVEGKSEYNLFAKFRDFFENEWGCINESIIFDSAAPASPSIMIGSGSVTSSSEQTIYLEATDAHEMYITNTADCTDGGSWEPISTSKENWTLAQENSAVSVYVKYRDRAGNETACLTDSITHDSIGPLAPDLVDDGRTTNSPTTSPSVSWSATTDSGSGITSYEVALGSSPGLTDFSDWKNVGQQTGTDFTNLNLSWGETAFATVRAVDEAGNLGTEGNGSGFIYGFLEQAYLKAPNADAADLFGRAVSISGDTVVVGAWREDSNQATIANNDTASPDNSNLESVAVYVFKRTGSTWTQEAYIKASNGNAGDFFGRQVAISGDTIVVGAWGEDSNQNTITNGATASADNTNTDSGAAYVFKRTGTTWVQEAYLKAANGETEDYFGERVAISDDTIVIGAGGEDSNQTSITNGSTASADNTFTDSGAVYVFKRTGSTWAQEAYIKAANADVDDYFGWPITISGDTIAVGSAYEDSNQTSITNGSTASADNSSAYSGAVYVYKRTGSTWAQEAYIKAVNSEADDFFGWALALSGDTLVVTAADEESGQNTITNGATASADNSVVDAGAVYIYKRTGSTWAQEAYLKAPYPDVDDYFGYYVAISGDLVAVSSYDEDSNQVGITNGATASSDNSRDKSGAVYVFKRTAGVWSQLAYIKSSNSDPEDRFGKNVSISGETIVAGAYAEDSNVTSIINGTAGSGDNSKTDSGAAYIIDL
ncbi:MAG: FG-GAP repeat protein [Oligoflexales bacterium]